MSKIESCSSHLSPEIVGRRNLVRAVLNPLLWHHVKQPHGLERAEELLDQGIGLLILINHFGKTDPAQVINNVVFAREKMRRKPITTPIAYHQQKPYINMLAGLTSINIKPIVTPDTIRLNQNDGLDQGTGLPHYINFSLQTLKHGGIVLLAPQAGRRERLGEPNKTMRLFMLQAKRRGVNNFGMLFIGLGIKGTTDYSERSAGGLNIGKTYEINIGPTFTQEEAILDAGRQNLDLDAWVFSQLAHLVPESYLGER